MLRSSLKVAFWTPIALLGIALILVLCAAAAVAALVTLLARAAYRAAIPDRTVSARLVPERVVRKEKPAAASRAG